MAEYQFLHDTLSIFAIEHSSHYNPGNNWLPSDIHIIAGGARGADNAAVDWAIVSHAPFTEYHADWEKYGKNAGPVRNQYMLDEGKPDIVLAFPSKNSRGTWDMVRRAEKAGVPVLIYKHE